MKKNFTINDVMLASFLHLSFNKKYKTKTFSALRPSKRVVRNIMQYSQSLQVVHSKEYGILTYHSN